MRFEPVYRTPFRFRQGCQGETRTLSTNPRRSGLATLGTEVRGRTPESRNTQPLGLRFRARLTEAASEMGLALT